MSRDQGNRTTLEGHRWLLGQIDRIPKEIPILLWGSIPCTGGSPWARFNLRRYPDTFPDQLRKLKAIWRQLTYGFYRIADVVTKRGGHWALEWPSKCDYWNSPHVQEFLSRQKGKVFEATATGCAFNLRAIAGPLKGKKMSKSWHIKSSIPTIEKYLNRSCSCPPNYEHAPTEGQNTAHSGRYTVEFVAEVHKMFASVARSNYEQNSATLHRNAN